MHILCPHRKNPIEVVKIWMKGVGGDFVFPVLVTVIAVTPKRVTITADDPDENGEGSLDR